MLDVPQCTTGSVTLYNSDHVRLEVPMMQGQLELPLGYSLPLEARILELPLSHRRMSLFLILPDYLNPGIHQLEANFTTHHIKALMSTLKVISNRQALSHNLSSLTAGDCQREDTKVQTAGGHRPRSGDQRPRGQRYRHSGGGRLWKYGQEEPGAPLQLQTQVSWVSSNIAVASCVSGLRWRSRSSEFQDPSIPTKPGGLEC